MKNYRLARIKNHNFSVRFMNIAKEYGYKTVGKFEKALRQARPHTKWSFYTSHTRGSRLIQEIEQFQETY